ncbi:DUF4170 domain-containing protein [Methyloligella sp. 2.7D]|uniref:DUF4170 domain-containing protein n=1 Tax=unclassified Methyloligella TaxID=2625955 RepID=UPI00157D0B0E|nr:DUF4170 domain-containing protein [Methyloligella sp. GL2]QKP78339.1 DUF4170 domain-containing protein [Methyloligella sp. GL2]
MVKPDQLLHLVFGGELTAVDQITFKDASALDVVGIFPDYQAAYDAWKEASHRNLDDALMRYFIVDLSELMVPDKDSAG